MCNVKNVPHAILIRSIEPIDGIDIMKQRRNIKINEVNLTNGPGKLSQALGITQQNNNQSLNKAHMLRKLLNIKSQYRNQ